MVSLLFDALGTLSHNLLYAQRIKGFGMRDTCMHCFLHVWVLLLPLA